MKPGYDFSEEAGMKGKPKMNACCQELMKEICQIIDDVSLVRRIIAAQKEVEEGRTK